MGSLLIHHGSSRTCKAPRMIQPRSPSSRCTYSEGRSRWYEGSKRRRNNITQEEGGNGGKRLVARASYCGTGNRIMNRLHGRRLAQNPGTGFLHGPPENHCEPQRFVASIRFPTLNLLSGTLEWTLSCKGSHDRPPDNGGSKY